MINHENWKDMAPAEKFVQDKTFFTWSWMNQFVYKEIRQAMIDMANEILRLRKKLRKLEAQ